MRRRERRTRRISHSSWIQCAVILGVSGGIAAYKAAELARSSAWNAGCTVQVVMTAAAQEFVRPLTFAALTGRQGHHRPLVRFGLEETLSSAVEHIRVAQENDVLVVAPATADLIAKFAPAWRTIFSPPLPGLHRTGGDRAGDEHQHVEASGHAGESRDPARTRAPDRGAGGRTSGLRDDRPGPARRTGGDRQASW